MRSAQGSAKAGLDGGDVRRLRAAMTRTRSVRLYRRLQAVWLVAQGQPIQEVARTVGASPASVYGWINQYRRTRRVEALMDAPRSGRPSTAAGIPDQIITSTLHADPMAFGYAATGWTVALLRQHLAHRYGVTVSARTLRRRLHALGWRWKRPRYVFADKEPHRAQKKGASYAA